LAGIAHQEHLDYRIYGTKGTLSLVNWTNLHFGKEGEVPQPVTVPLNERLIQLLDEIVKKMNGEEARLVTFDTGVKVQKVLEDLLGKA